MNTNNNTEITQDDLNLLTHREALVVRAMLEKEPTTITAAKFNVTSSWVHGIRAKALNRIAHAKKMKALKDSSDKVGIYMLPVDDVFSGKTAAVLKRSGFERVGDLRGMNDYKLLHIRDAGKKLANEVRQFFQEYGLEFGYTPKPEETFEDRVAQYMFGKLCSKRNVGMSKLHMVASIVIYAGLITEESFAQIVGTKTPEPK